MQRSLAYLTVVIALIGIGMALSFYGAQLSTQDLQVNEGILSGGDSLEVLTDLDPSINENGVFVVQTFGYQGNGITAKVFDPTGIELISKSIDVESYEERFQINSKGSHKLVIENFGQDEVQIAGVIGHMPDNLTLSIGITGLYLIIVGLIGTVGVGIYVFKTRRKEKPS